jgi:hypothetical protein
VGNTYDDAWLTSHQTRLAGLQGPAVRHALDTVPPPATAPAKKKRPRHEEDTLQQQVASFLNWALPSEYRWLHVPNGGRRDRVAAAILKSFGVKAGAADVLIFTPGSRFIWIELKAEKGVLSKDQKDWRDWCRTIGAPWFLCRSLDDLIVALESLQIRLKGRPI